MDIKILLCLFVLLLLPQQTLQARQAMGQMAVSTSVKSYFTLKNTQLVSKLVIDAQDIHKRGYIDVPNATRLVVKTNDRAGYALVFEVAPSAQPLFTSIEVTGLGQTVVLSPTGGTVQVPYLETVSFYMLSYHFVLAKQAKQGRYAWPVSLSETH